MLNSKLGRWPGRVFRDSRKKRLLAGVAGMGWAGWIRGGSFLAGFCTLGGETGGTGGRRTTRLASEEYKGQRIIWPLFSADWQASWCQARQRASGVALARPGTTVDCGRRPVIGLPFCLAFQAPIHRHPAQRDVLVSRQCYLHAGWNLTRVNNAYVAEIKTIHLLAPHVIHQQSLAHSSCHCR